MKSSTMSGEKTSSFVKNRKKVVLITGTSSGLGKSCAELFSKEGWQVYGTSTSRFSLPTTSNNYEMIEMDLRNLPSIDFVINSIKKKEGRLDALVNNAGIGFASPVADAPFEKIKDFFQINYFGWVYLIQKAIPLLINGTNAKIINVSSLAGRFALPYNGYYCSAKFAIEAITESLRMELASLGIKVGMVEPGDLSTPFTRSKVIYVKPGGFFEDSFGRVLKITNRDEENGTSPIKAAKKIYELINKKNIPIRTLVDIKSKGIIGALRILPFSFFQKLLVKYYNL